MKKFVSLMLVFTLCAAMLAGCGSAGKQETSAPTETTQSAPAYDSALALMEAVWATYGESERIPAAGGDMEHDNMDGPGLFDIEKNAEMFQSLILVDETLLGMLENDAATLLHMMNTNTFCSAVMQLQEGEDPAAFAESYKTIVQSNHWMCGFPDTVVVLNLGSFVLTAYGKNDPIQNFKDIAVSLGAQLLVEAPAES